MDEPEGEERRETGNERRRGQTCREEEWVRMAGKKRQDWRGRRDVEGGRDGVDEEEEEAGVGGRVSRKGSSQGAGGVIGPGAGLLFSD